MSLVGEQSRFLRSWIAGHPPEDWSYISGNLAFDRDASPAIPRSGSASWLGQTSAPPSSPAFSSRLPLGSLVVKMEPMQSL